MCLLILEGETSSMWERNINQVPPVRALSRDQIRYPGLCPDRESNERSLGAQDDAPANYTTCPAYNIFCGLKLQWDWISG